MSRERDTKKKGAIRTCLACECGEDEEERERRLRAIAVKEQERREKKELEKEIRPFKFRIDKLRVFLDERMSGFFLEMKIGGLVKRRTTDETETVPRKRKITNEDGSTSTEIVADTVFKKEERIICQPAARCCTKLRSVKAKTKLDIDECFEGKWVGRYTDLEQQLFIMRLWKFNRFGMNLLVGQSLIPLQKIVGGQMRFDVELYKCGRKLDMSVNVKRRRESVGYVGLKFEFGEVYPYRIEFRDWQVTTLHRKDAPHLMADKLVETEPLLAGGGGSDDEGDSTHAPSAADNGDPKASETVAKSVRQLDCAILSAQTGGFSWARCLLCCLASSQQGISETRVDMSRELRTNAFVGPIKRDTSILHYPSTWAHLEDSILDMRLRKTSPPWYACGCMPGCAPVVSRAELNLQGVLDYGYVHTDGVPLDLSLSQCCCWTPFQVNDRVQTAWTGVLDGSSPNDKVGPLPKFRQIGNIDPTDRPPSFFESMSDMVMGTQGGSGKTTTFLVCRVVRASGLHLVPMETPLDTLTSFATVQWGVNRRDTRSIHATTEPDWNEEIYFKIRTYRAPEKLADFPLDEDLVGSDMVIEVWHTEYFNRRLLGYCVVPFKDIYLRRKVEKSYLSIAGRGRKSDKRVYSVKKRLITPLTEMTPGKFLSSSSNDKDGGVSDESSDQELSDCAFVELQFYFDRTDAKIIHKSRSGISKGDPQLRRLPLMPGRSDGLPYLQPKPLLMAREYWWNQTRVAADFEDRLFPFYGLDKYSGQKFFLPSFLDPVYPPRDILLLHQLLYFVHSVEHVVSGDKRRGDKAGIGDGDEEDDNEFRNVPLDDPACWSWADPYFVAERRKGDEKDHAMLLCSFLLGLGRPDLSAYVCIGTARSITGEVERHVWVMTLEIERELGRQEPRKIVRFWEPSNGKVYVMSDDSFFDSLVWDGTPFKGSVAVVRDAVKPGSDDEKDGIDPDTEREEEEPEIEHSVVATAEDTKENQVVVHSGPDEKLSRYQRVAMEYLHEENKLDAESKNDLELLGLSVNQSLAQPDLTETQRTTDTVMQQEKGETNTKLAVGSLNAPKHPSMVSTSVTDPKVRLVTPAEGNLVRVAIDRQKLQYRERLQEQLKSEHLQELKRSKDRKLPYASLDVVFNHRTLWANLQSKDPELISYQLNDRARWVEFSAKNRHLYFGFDRVSPFSRGVVKAVSAAPFECAEVEEELVARIRSTIKTFRSYHVHATTEFVDQFEFQRNTKVTAADHLRSRLQHEAESGFGSRSVLLRLKDYYYRERDKAGDRFEGLKGEQVANMLRKIRKGNDALSDYLPSEVLNEAQARVKDFDLATWRRRISLDYEGEQNYEYREVMFTFKHSDPIRIVDTFVSKCAHNVLALPDRCKARYAISAYVEPLPAKVSPVRVLMVVYYKKQ